MTRSKETCDNLGTPMCRLVSTLILSECVKQTNSTAKHAQTSPCAQTLLHLHIENAWQMADAAMEAASVCVTPKLESSKTPADFTAAEDTGAGTGLQTETIDTVEKYVDLFMTYRQPHRDGEDTPGWMAELALAHQLGSSKLC